MTILLALHTVFLARIFQRKRLTIICNGIPFLLTSKIQFPTSSMTQFQFRIMSMYPHLFLIIHKSHQLYPLCRCQCLITHILCLLCLAVTLMRRHRKISKFQIQNSAMCPAIWENAKAIVVSRTRLTTNAVSVALS